ncbi:ATP-binding protein [Streptomyces sp. NPDC005480]|uniref:ATP-binding protein n=1 Tax=Streptomyces sp. NPDC005480 TaxID=3154880 RepID=UPI0033A6F175
MSAHLIADIIIPSRPKAVSQARRALAALVPDCETADDGRLLMSEAVANAVEHTQSTDVRVVIRHEEVAGRLVCAVHDDNPQLPPSPAEQTSQDGWEEAESGRGLGLIKALSESWGFSTDGFGKWLWFTLDSRPAV